MKNLLQRYTWRNPAAANHLLAALCTAQHGL